MKKVIVLPISLFLLVAAACSYTSTTTNVNVVSNTNETTITFSPLVSINTWKTVTFSSDGVTLQAPTSYITSGPDVIQNTASSEYPAASAWYRIQPAGRTDNATALLQLHVYSGVTAQQYLDYVLAHSAFTKKGITTIHGNTGTVLDTLTSQEVVFAKNGKLYSISQGTASSSDEADTFTTMLSTLTIQ